MDHKTESVLREMCKRGPVDFDDMLGLIERYQPPIPPADFAAYVIRERLTCGTNEAAATCAIRRLAAEQDHRQNLAIMVDGRPDAEQIRKALGVA